MVNGTNFDGFVETILIVVSITFCRILWKWFEPCNCIFRWFVVALSLDDESVFRLSCPLSRSMTRFNMPCQVVIDLWNSKHTNLQTIIDVIRLFSKVLCRCVQLYCARNFTWWWSFGCISGLNTRLTPTNRIAIDGSLVTTYLQDTFDGNRISPHSKTVKTEKRLPEGQTKWKTKREGERNATCSFICYVFA